MKRKLKYLIDQKNIIDQNINKKTFYRMKKIAFINFESMSTFDFDSYQLCHVHKFLY